jgi:hypothetical protein
MQLRSGSPQFAHRLRVDAWGDFMGGKHNRVKGKFSLKVSREDSLERHSPLKVNVPRQLIPSVETVRRVGLQRRKRSSCLNTNENSTRQYLFTAPK